MTDLLSLQVRFHGPFHVLTGSSDEGVDATVDTEHPLPESSIKGLMRASAVRLGLGESLVGEVFGRSGRHGGPGRGAAAPWAWRCQRDDDPQLRVRASVPIDDGTGAATSGLIRFAEELWSESVTVTVERMAWIPPVRREIHADVLRASARGVTSLGHDRNRGYGWVTITEPGRDTTTEAHRLAVWVLEQQEVRP